jgi:hypothetical protein
MEKAQDPFQPRKISLLDLAMKITAKNLEKGKSPRNNNGPRALVSKAFKKISNKRVKLYRNSETGEVLIHIKDNMHAQGLSGVKVKYAVEIAAFKNSNLQTLTL